MCIYIYIYIYIKPPDEFLSVTYRKYLIHLPVLALSALQPCLALQCTQPRLQVVFLSVLPCSPLLVVLNGLPISLIQRGLVNSLIVVLYSLISMLLYRCQNHHQHHGLTSMASLATTMSKRRQCVHQILTVLRAFVERAGSNGELMCRRRRWSLQISVSCCSNDINNLDVQAASVEADKCIQATLALPSDRTAWIVLNSLSLHAPGSLILKAAIPVSATVESHLQQCRKHHHPNLGGKEPPSKHHHHTLQDIATLPLLCMDILLRPQLAIRGETHKSLRHHHLGCLNAYSCLLYHPPSSRLVQ